MKPHLFLGFFLRPRGVRKTSAIIAITWLATLSGQTDLWAQSGGTQYRHSDGVYHGDTSPSGGDSDGYAATIAYARQKIEMAERGIKDCQTRKRERQSSLDAEIKKMEAEKRELQRKIDEAKRVLSDLRRQQLSAKTVTENLSFQPRINQWEAQKQLAESHYRRADSKIIELGGEKTQSALDNSCEQSFNKIIEEQKREIAKAEANRSRPRPNPAPQPPPIPDRPSPSPNNPRNPSLVDPGLPPQPPPVIFETDQERRKREAAGIPLPKSTQYEDYVDAFEKNRAMNSNPVSPGFYDQDPNIVKYDGAGNGIDAWGYVVEYQSEAARKAAIIENRAGDWAKRTETPAATLPPAGSPPRPLVTASPETQDWLALAQQRIDYVTKNKDIFKNLSYARNYADIEAINSLESMGMIKKYSAEIQRQMIKENPNSFEQRFYDNFSRDFKAKWAKENGGQPSPGSNSLKGNPADKMTP